jgi:release factor glutamine methyltransferase
MLQGEALPYLLGRWEFFGRSFLLNENVLIPRPETEQLVERALQHLKGVTGSPRALDVGTGSGCIAISLAAEHQRVRMVATDVSFEALQVAKKNSVFHEVEDRISLVQCHLATALTGKFALVCANLPYIPSERLSQLEVSHREPTLALDGGHGGLDLIRELLVDLPDKINEGGLILLEIDARAEQKIIRLAGEVFMEAVISVHKDLAGLARIVAIEVQRVG